MEKKKKRKTKQLLNEDAYLESNANLHICKYKYYGDIYDQVS